MEVRGKATVLIYEGKTLDHNDGMRMVKIIKSFPWFRQD